MAVKKLLTGRVNEFDLERCINDIKENLKDYIEPKYACLYMRPSRVEKGAYVALDEEELAEENITGNFKEDLAKNDRILYVRFILDETLVSEKVKFVLGNGDILEEEDIEGYDFGDFDYCEDMGFIIKSINGNLTIEPAYYDRTVFCQYIAVVAEPGDFQLNMIPFINNYFQKED